MRPEEAAQNRTMTEAQPREGGCQCGNLRYRLTAAPLRLYVCHCRDCQKQSSSAFGMSLIMRPEAVLLLRREPKVWTTRADSGAIKTCAFCRDCGSRIYHATDDKHAPISIKAGTLDDTAWLQPSDHIWTSHAQRWLHLEAGAFRLSPREPADEGSEPNRSGDKK